MDDAAIPWRGALMGSNGEVPRRSRLHGQDGPIPGLAEDAASAADGSIASFERIYRALSPVVAGYLRGHGVSDVESVTNEVFAQVHRRLGTFSGGDEGFRSWVFTIAHHRMVDERRRAARRPRLDGDAEVSETAAVGDVEAEALVALGDDRLRAMLGRLSADQREVLLLRVVADLSLEDVARALGKRQGAIKALQHRAISSLRRQLERERVQG